MQWNPTARRSFCVLIGTALILLAGTSIAGALDGGLGLIDWDNLGGDWVNYPPCVEAGPDQVVAEGDTVIFGATVSDSPEDSLAYSWDFGDGTTATGSLAPSHVYGDDGVFVVTLVVTDNWGAVTSDSLAVTVTDVAPTLGALSLSQPNDLFVLPGIHLLTLATSVFDPGSDDILYEFDFGDGSGRTTLIFNDADPGDVPDPYPSPDINATYRQHSIDHTYASPGDYLVRLRATDDDGGTSIVARMVHVGDEAEALEAANEYVRSLPETAFEGRAARRKAAVDYMFVGWNKMLALQKYEGLAASLGNNLRAKADDSCGGLAANDWITPVEAQKDLCLAIDDIVAYLRWLLGNQ